MSILFWLLVGHALADFSLQSEWMAKAKDRHSGQGVTFLPAGQKAPVLWPFVLSSHALIHGGAVALATGSAWLGLAETVAHFWIDFGKCENYYGFYVDQALHVMCKLVWLFAVLAAR